MKRTPLKRKTQLSRGSGPKRKVPANRLQTTRKATRTSFPTAHDPAHFARVVTASRRCAMCGRPGRQDAHHVLPAKLLKKLGLHEHLYDPRNGIPLGSIRGGACHCHEGHENRMHPIPLSKLPPEALEFAREHGLEWRLERLYPAP